MHGVSKSLFEKNPNAIRYRVEFVPTPELLSHIVSRKKLDNYNENTNKHYYSVAEINEISVISGMEEYSYDVETESDHFEVSGIYSHNCRTANGWDVNGLGQQKDGRGNICPVTIILPTLAMEARGIVDNWDAETEKPMLSPKAWNPGGWTFGHGGDIADTHWL